MVWMFWMVSIQRGERENDREWRVVSKKEAHQSLNRGASSQIDKVHLCVRVCEKDTVDNHYMC